MRGTGAGCVIMVMTVALVATGRTAPTKHRIAPAEISGVVQAVEDEIYDYGYEGDYYQMGKNLGTPRKWISQMPIYINPEMNDGDGVAIYRFMHDTIEVYRHFGFDEAGFAVLDLDPESGFPPTQASTKTIYMDDEDVCRMKRDWLKRWFVINTSPDFKMVEAAAAREFRRTGHSYWQTNVLPHLRGRDVPRN